MTVADPASPQSNPKSARTFAQSADCACAGSLPGRSVAGSVLLLERVHQPQRAFADPSETAPTSSSSASSGTTPSKSRTSLSENCIAAIGACLLQQRQGIAQAAFRHSRNHRHRAGLDLQVFLFSRSLPGAPQSPQTSVRENESAATSSGSYQPGLPVASWPSRRSRVRRLFERLQQGV